MGDKSPKNKHKQEWQRHDKKVKKVNHAHANAEAQHHPVSGHPATPAVEPATDTEGTSGSAEEVRE